MDKTLIVAVLTLVVIPLTICIIQNMIVRIGKKDDITLAREGLILQREQAIEAKRVQTMTEVEMLLRDTQEKLKAKDAECDRLTKLLDGTGTQNPVARPLTEPLDTKLSGETNAQS